MSKIDDKVCSLISEWWTGGKKGSMFSMSGGVMISAKRNGSPVTDEWNVATFAKINVLDLMHTNSNIYKTWIKHLNQSYDMAKEPIMFFAYKKHLYMIIEHRYFAHLEDHFGGNNEMLYTKAGKFCVICFSTFVNWVPNIKLALGSRTRR